MANLTAEQLQQLLAGQYRAPTSGSGYDAANPYGLSDANLNQSIGGDTFHTAYNSSGSVQDGGINYALTGYFRDVVPGRNQVGDMQDMYDLYGKYIATAAIPPDTSFRDFLILAAGLTGAGALTAAGAGAAGAAGAAGTGGATGAGGLTGYDAAMADLAASAGPGFGATTAGGGLLGTLGTVGSTLGGASSLLGPAATLLGAAAGAQGQDKTTTETRKTDPRVDPYLFGNNGQPGLLQYAYNQLSRDQSPESLANLEKMKSTGMGLLSQPVAGNGFGLFTKGRY